MAVAAPILPPAPAELDLPRDVQIALRAKWAGWWEPLREELRAAPPAFDSPDERMALARFARGLVSITAEFGDVLRPLLVREGFARVFEDLVRAEELQAPPIRRLALKFVERAVDVLGELFEAATAFAPPSLPVEALSQLLLATDEALAPLLDAPSVALLRLELYTFVAFDLVRDESVEEFATWARRARVAAQAAAPYVARFAAIARVAPSGDPSPDVTLTDSEFTRLAAILENPPAPSERLRRLVARGSA
jgi:hypothetical protein